MTGIFVIVSKVLGCCTFNNIKEVLYGMVNECQHGFVTGKPCITNLIETLEYTRPILDSGGHVDLLYLDVCQAFDYVDDALLIYKLRRLGFG